MSPGVLGCIQPLVSLKRGSLESISRTDAEIHLRITQMRLHERECGRWTIVCGKRSEKRWLAIRIDRFRVKSARSSEYHFMMGGLVWVWLVSNLVCS